MTINFAKDFMLNLFAWAKQYQQGVRTGNQQWKSTICMFHPRGQGTYGFKMSKHKGPRPANTYRGARRNAQFNRVGAYVHPNQ